MNLGAPEIIGILIIVLLLFGSTKLHKLARSLGEASKEFKKGVTSFRSRAEFEALLAAYEKWRAPFLDEQGELRAQYRSAPMVATFMLDPRDPAVLRRAAIPVPKGPVEVW